MFKQSLQVISGGILLASVLATAAPAQPAGGMRHGPPATSTAVAIQDRLEIQDLLYRYAHYVDNGLGEAWASTFTPDGRLEYFGSVIKGRSALAAFASQNLAFYPTHFVGDTLMVQTAPGRVHARSMVIVAARAKTGSPTEFHGVPIDSPTQVLGVGVYDDEIVKTKAGWRFEVRRAGSTGVAPVHPDFLPAALR